MVIQHYLNGKIIDEPIGFDSLKMTMKRGDYHGMSAEVSEETLEFYGSAANTIKNAYNTDIDTELTYKVKVDGNEIYSGVLDLSTYEEQYSDYFSVSCKVGEVGVKTTFNNRTDSEIDLISDLTIDGAAVETATTWQNLNIPAKSLIYTDSATTPTDNVNDAETLMTLTPNSRCNWISIVPPNINTEFGTQGTLVRVISGRPSTDDYIGANNLVHLSNDTEMCLFREDEDFESKYGENTVMEIDYNVSVDITFKSVIFNESERYVSGIMQASLLLMGGSEYAAVPAKVDGDINHPDADGTYRQYILAESNLGVNFTNTNLTTTMTLSGKLKKIPTSKNLYLGISLFNRNVYNHVGTWYGIPGNCATPISMTIKKGSYVKIKMFDNRPETDEAVNADVLLVKDALNKAIEKISENALHLRSEWYSIDRANFKFGGGALKALTTGYKIRGIEGLETDDEDEDEDKYAMSTSFKDMIESLSAMDCIGWGFSEESGITYVRVERFDWFYKDDVLLTISNPNEIKRKLATDGIFSSLEIGYEKYATNEQYNSIDSPFGERTFVSSLKAISNTKKLNCKFVADSYAIEETRRAKFDKSETEETTYDDCIICFELEAFYNVAFEVGKVVYSVAKNIEKASGIYRPNEQINVQLTPRRCAERWAKVLFPLKKDLKYSSTEGSAAAVFQCRPATGWTNSRRGVKYAYLQDFANGQSLAENADINQQDQVYTAETIEFTYPISAAEYKAIKANPYGLIKVNGILGWIKEFSYSFSDGEATFTLIPKAN